MNKKTKYIVIFSLLACLTIGTVFTDYAKQLGALLADANVQSHPLSEIEGSENLIKYDSEGNVGIGLVSPSAKLHVDGNIIASNPTADNHVATKKYVDDLIEENLSNLSPEEDLDLFVPVGAEGYNSSGQLVVPRGESGHISSNKGMIVFKNIGSYSLDIENGQDVEVLIIAGGGGSCTGGGGAGGVIYKQNFNIASFSTVPIVVGSGGPHSTNGQNSSLGSLVALGGGRGGCNCFGCPGSAGGSGGGGGADSSGGAGNQPSSSSGGYGNAGAYGYDGYGSTVRHGGGGGAGAEASGSYGGSGMSVWGFTYASGGTATYGGGGTGVVGVPNTGQGGGAGNAGGSGIVAIRFGGYSYNYDPTIY